MSREEEIRNKAKNKYPYIKGLPQTLAHQEIFIEGAKWADKNPKRYSQNDETQFDDMINIEIKTNGALAMCKVDGKYISQCDKETIIRVLSAFRCIEQGLKRDKLI